MAADPSKLTGVLGGAPPRIPAPEAAEVAERFFGLAGDPKPLASERDQNFLIEGSGSAGVLKISNAAESTSVLDMETGAALHALAADPELPIAAPLPPATAQPGGYRVRIDGPDRSQHWARMFELMPGRASFDPRELDRDGLRGFGVIVARVGRALRAFTHPSAGRKLLWDVRHALDLRSLVPRVPDPGRRALLERTLGQFEARVSPILPHLRHQMIHGDLSADNTTIDDEGRVVGILDFGDSGHSALACDISSAWASLVWDRPEDELFEAARVLLDGYRAITPLEELEVRVLGDLFAARAAAAATIAADRLAHDPGNSYVGGFDEHAWPLLELYDGLGPDEFARRLGYRDQRSPRNPEKLVARRAAAFGEAISPPTYNRPLQIASADGVWMTDAEGHRVLDAYNNVPVLGHGHPRVVEAIAHQARALNTNMRYLHPAAIELAERLVDSMPADSGLDTVMLVNSGTEANDLACRLAGLWTRNDGAVVSSFAYHGISDATARLSPEGWGSERPGGVAVFDPAGEAGVAGGVASALAALEREGRPAAVVIADPAFTSDGIHPPSAGDLAEAAELSRAAGALYIADEVQVGHGRTGEDLWAFAAAGVRPDFVTTGKPMGNGYPVAALITRAEIAERFGRETEFFSTFGGNPPAAAAALAVLDVIRDEDLIARAGGVGDLLATRLRLLCERRREITAVRSWGLIMGVELSAPEGGRVTASRVADEMRERDVLVGVTGPARDTLKIRPPLAFGREDAETLIAALEESIEAAAQ